MTLRVRGLTVIVSVLALAACNSTAKEKTSEKTLINQDSRSFSQSVSDANDFCLSSVLHGAAAQSLTAKRFATSENSERKRSFYLESSQGTVFATAKIGGRRPLCTVSVSPRQYGGDARGVAVLGLLDWAKSSGVNVTKFVKGQMQVVKNGAVVNITLEQGKVRAREYAKFTFIKQK